jgi:hypothetical protein
MDYMDIPGESNKKRNQKRLTRILEGDDANTLPDQNR